MTDNRFASKLPDTSDSVYDAAPRYALLGFRVIPIHTPENGLCSCNKGDTCHAVGKHPRVRNTCTERLKPDYNEVHDVSRAVRDGVIDAPDGWRTRRSSLGR